jgi:hypothetical protein
MSKEKKGGAAAGSAAAAAEAEITRCKTALLTNITTACGLTGFPAHPRLLAACAFEAPEPEAGAAADAAPAAAPGAELLAVRGAIGAPNVRALCAALLARGLALDQTPYTPAKRLELLDSGAGDSGAGSVADVLRNGALVGVALESVALVRAGIGPAGAASLGAALMLGANSSLLSLSLDCNAFGDAGARLLARGLLTNRTLRRLSLASTGIRADGALDIASVVNSPICVLEAVDLSGNDIGLVGLRALSVSALYSKTLAELVRRRAQSISVRTQVFALTDPHPPAHSSPDAL